MNTSESRKLSQGGNAVYSMIALKVELLLNRPGPRQAVTLPSHIPNMKASAVPMPNNRMVIGRTPHNNSPTGAPGPPNVIDCPRSPCSRRHSQRR